MAKNILIIGSTKGIGKACANLFASKGHTVTGVARSSTANIVGDITNKPFRDSVIQSQDPDVVINCVGGWGDRPYAATFHKNAAVAVDLLLNFYQKLKPGSHIITVSSLAGNFTAGWKGMEYERINYMSAKQAVSAAHTALAQSKRRDIHVTTIEPGEVHPTNFGEYKEIDADNYNNFNFDSFTPYKPTDIADVIEWVVSRPPWFGLSKITLNNHCRSVR